MRYLIILFFIFAYCQLCGQNTRSFILSGEVLADLTTHPLEGASVTIKRTKFTVRCNDKGKFSLVVNPFTDTIIISHIGYVTTEIGGSANLIPNIRILLINANSELSEVSVVSDGYQQIPKERATGSFEIINNQKFNRIAGSDILSRLEGVAPGILMDKRTSLPSQTGVNLNNVVIRGISTLTDGIKSPLIILNNFPFEGDLQSINPNDVENITVLKDAAAASIWGARAANGVIVITTKTGKYNQSPRISINSNTQILDKPDLFYYPVISASDMIDLEKFLFDGGRYNSALNDIWTFPALTPAVEIFAKERSGAITSDEATLQLNALRNNDVRKDYAKFIYRNALLQQNSIQVSGGSSAIKYTLSGGIDRQFHNLTGNDDTRLTFRSDNTITPFKKTEIMLSVMYSSMKGNANSLGEYGSNSYDVGIFKLPIYSQLADANGNPLPIALNYRLGFTDTAGNGKLLNWNYKPLDELKSRDISQHNKNITVNTAVKYSVTDWLNIQLSYQYQNTSGELRSFQGIETYNTRNLINQFTQFNGNTIRRLVPLGGILDENFSRLTSNTVRGNLNVQKAINSHSVNFIGGGEVREAVTLSSSKRAYGFNPNNYSSSSVDFENSHLFYNGMGIGRIPTGNSNVRLSNKFISAFANMGYSYKNTYVLSASLRRDATNQFGVATNDRWKPFWSFGGLWNISNEKFLKLRVNEYLRVRATYGVQGNVNNTLSPLTIITYSNANVSIINQPFATIGIPANPDLSWENVKQLNLGIDFRLLKGRISGSLEWYRKQANDVILNRNVDPTTGILAVAANSANMLTKGIDFSITTTNINKPIMWNTELLFSYNTNVVTKYLLNDATRRVSGIVNTSSTTIRPFKGYDPYAIFSLPFAGLDPTTGDPIGYLGKEQSVNYSALLNQNFDTANIVYHGSGLPRVFGYFNNIFKYKKVSLTAAISYRLGYYFRKNTISYFRLYNNGITNPDYNKRWQNTGDEVYTNIPSARYPLSNSQRDDFYSGSSVNVLKGDNIRLQYIRIDYDFKLPRIVNASLSLFISANNLGILWKANKEGIDPDFNISNYSFPQTKHYTFGVKANF